MSKLSIFEGGKIFIDANIFIYIFTEHPKYVKECASFLRAVENKEIPGYSSYLVLLEVAHKLICAEVCEKYNILPNKVISFLKRRPAVISQLGKYKVGISQILSLPLTLLPINEREFLKAVAFVKKYSILISDSFHAAVCETHDIKNIASNDEDFKRVDFLKSWKP